jgi:hypothetical protein
MVKVSPPPVLVVRPQGQRDRRWTLLALLGVVWTLSLAAALEFGRRGAGLQDPAVAASSNKEHETLLQRIAVLERAEQVSRAAYSDLQQSLHDRQEEISALRADLAFYSRLTNGGKLEALNVHGVHLQAGASPRVYNFSVTLTQTLKSGQIASGHVHLSVNGVQDGKLTALSWNEIAPNQDGSGLPFAFKYFQQIAGTLMLPEGFSPNRIRVEADGGSEMGRADQEFSWNEALADQEGSDVQH